MFTPTLRRVAAARFSRFLPGLTCLFVATAVPSVAAQGPHVVSGTVKTADGRPLAGATIRISGAVGAARGTTVRTQSDRSGRYRVQVRPGHYDVDAFVDLTFDGQTYKEFWLDRTNEGCERQLSDEGIVRHFVLRLSGPLRCAANFDANAPTSYAGAMLLVNPGSLPAGAHVRFTLTPIGPLADGSTGRVMTFDRSGAMLATGGGRLGQNAWLHDIPLGRYRVSAEAAMPGGRRKVLVLRDNAGGRAATSIEIGFPAVLMAPYGIRSAALTIEDGPADALRPVPGGGDTPAPIPPRPGGPVRNAIGLPAGRYECSYQSPYVGEIPNGRVVVVLDSERYQAWGGSGSYARTAQGVQWISGPLAARGVSASFAEANGRAVLTVRGGAAGEDPGGTNRCVRAGS